MDNEFKIMEHGSDADGMLYHPLNGLFPDHPEFDILAFQVFSVGELHHVSHYKDKLGRWCSFGQSRRGCWHQHGQGYKL